MRDSRAFPPDPDPDGESSGVPRAQPLGDAAGERPEALPAPVRIPPLLPRRQTPWLLVEVDGSPACSGSLAWALREAARREATVVAVSVLDDDPVEPTLDVPVTTHRQGHAAARELLDAQVLRAIGETGVHGRVRTAVLERAVFEALSAAAHGADLVIVGTECKTLLRQAVARPPHRRLPRGA